MLPRGARIVSLEVLSIEYVNVDDDDDIARVHEFSEGVVMLALKDGSILLTRPDGRELWDDFPAPAEGE